MVSKIQKWGNSLALRIPKPFADSIGFDEETEVEIYIEDNKLIVTKSASSTYVLGDLISQITSDNIHEEIDFGDPIGHESW